MLRDISVSYHVQQGSSQTLRVTTGDRWYVVKETWEGSLLLKSDIVYSSMDEEDANAKLAELKNNTY